MKLILKIAWWLPGKFIHKWACRKRAELANKEQVDKRSHLRKLAKEWEKAFLQQGEQYIRRYKRN